MTHRVVLRRRGLLRAGLASGVAAASAALPIAGGLGIQPEVASADSHSVHQAQPPAPLGGFTYFNTFQAEIVNAAAGRLIPSDANGPGATEAGVVFFIDRQLSASYGLTGRRYEHGPYAMGTPTQGDQSGLDLRDRYRLGIQGMQDYAQQVFHKGFAQLSSDQQDRILTDMQAGVPSTFAGNSIQAATTQAAGSGPGVGPAESVCRRCEQLPAERRIQPDRDCWCAGLPRCRRDCHPLLTQPSHAGLRHRRQ